jgi:hypothetical protein
LRTVRSVIWSRRACHVDVYCWIVLVVGMVPVPLPVPSFPDGRAARAWLGMQ